MVKLLHSHGIRYCQNFGKEKWWLLHKCVIFVLVWFFFLLESIAINETIRIHVFSVRHKVNLQYSLQEWYVICLKTTVGKVQ